jgi:hypothetical protein
MRRWSTAASGARPRCRSSTPRAPAAACEGSTSARMRQLLRAIVDVGTGRSANAPASAWAARPAPPSVGRAVAP